jgi:hypothetical protein
MTATPTAPAVDRDTHHPLAYCEFCGQPVDEPRADCPDPICQEAWQDLLRPFRRSAT